MSQADSGTDKRTYRHLLRVTLFAVLMQAPLDVAAYIIRDHWHPSWILGFLATIIYIWAEIKILQSAYLVWSKLEFRTRDVFWGFVAATILSSLAAFALIGLLSQFIGRSMDSAQPEVIMVVVGQLLFIPMMAQFIRIGESKDADRRTWYSLWRPFYTKQRIQAPEDTE